MNDLSPFISVIIPYLNQRRTLDRCLWSLNRQSYPRSRFEIIVVDNGSREGPEDAVASVGLARLERERTPGPGPARNKGVSVANGEILAFIDADCVAEENWLASISTRLDGAPAKTILGGDVRIALCSPGRLSILEAYESVFAYRQKEYIEMLGFSGTGNLAMRREDFEAVGPFGGLDVAEDRDWGRRAIALGYSITYVPTMVVYHPSRRSFRELFEKWDRHVAHDRMEWETAGRSRTAWIIRACAVAASPLIDVYAVLASKRLSGSRARLLALMALVGVRLYRSARMLKLAFVADGIVENMSWNRGQG